MMFIYIHILFLFSIHGLSHHHHLLPQWSIVNRSSSRSVTVFKYIYLKKKSSKLTSKNHIIKLMLLLLLLGYVCVCLLDSLGFYSSDSKVRKYLNLYSNCRKEPFSQMIIWSLGWLIISTIDRLTYIYSYCSRFPFFFSFLMLLLLLLHDCLLDVSSSCTNPNLAFVDWFSFSCTWHIHT